VGRLRINVKIVVDTLVYNPSAIYTTNRLAFTMRTR